MTIDKSAKKINQYINNSDQTMATSTMTPNNHFKTPSATTTSSQEPMELSSRLTKMHINDRHSGEANIPRRQPTIVCEDIADDIDFDDEELTEDETYGKESDQKSSGVVRSASSASLSVPQSGELDCGQEKRRPPLTDDHMLIESN
ncbi:uncharacterized protein LOC128952237 [Oppia nitens]|uniref:uncharacterized protein LOC128952237 n=1 Tax=Oppia nitens TaxID=1686743 RepID=UPI0023DBB7B4|nr:uncharacterized protein LOC128952237 [Oppia nitens]